MRRPRFTIRNLMLLTALCAVDVSILTRIWGRSWGDSGIATFLVSSLLTLNLSGSALVWVVSRTARASPEDQFPLMMSMGCLLVLILISAAPVLMFLLYSWSVEG